jgi:succinate dehydrogenase hydrophobic anchor subunit
MKLRTKLTALIVGGFVLGYLMIAFVTLEIDFRNWSEGARSGFLAAYLWVTVVLCFMTWMHHDEGGDK